MEHVDALKQLGACKDAVDWAGEYPSAQAAWNACERGDWMLWLVGKVDGGKPWSDQRRRLVGAAADCAALAPELNDAGAELARQWAIDAAWRFAGGEDNRDEVIAAVNAAYVACAAGAARAAYVAADAARAAYGGANAAAYAANVAANAAYIAYAARKQVLKDCANIVRRHYPQSPI